MVIPSISCRTFLKRKDFVRTWEWCLFFFCLLFIFSCNVAVGSENRTEQKQTLVGIKDLVVYVNIGLSKSGPTQTKLQDLVERKFSNAGLIVHSKEEEKEESTIPSLYINVAVAKGKNNFHTFFVTMRFFQIVSLEQGERVINPFAATWEGATLGVGGIENIQEKVEDLIEVFLRDYRRVN